MLEARPEIDIAWVEWKVQQFAKEPKPLFSFKKKKKNQRGELSEPRAKVLSDLYRTCHLHPANHPSNRPAMLVNALELCHTARWKHCRLKSKLNRNLNREMGFYLQKVSGSGAHKFWIVTIWVCWRKSHLDVAAVKSLPFIRFHLQKATWKLNWVTLIWRISCLVGRPAISMNFSVNAQSFWAPQCPPSIHTSLMNPCNCNILADASAKPTSGCWSNLFGYNQDNED